MLMTISAMAAMGGVVVVGVAASFPRKHIERSRSARSGSGIDGDDVDKTVFISSSTIRRCCERARNLDVAPNPSGRNRAEGVHSTLCILRKHIERSNSENTAACRDAPVREVELLFPAPARSPNGPIAAKGWRGGLPVQYSCIMIASEFVLLTYSSALGGSALKHMASSCSRSTILSHTIRL